MKSRKVLVFAVRRPVLRFHPGVGSTFIHHIAALPELLGRRQSEYAATAESLKFVRFPETNVRYQQRFSNPSKWGYYEGKTANREMQKRQKNTALESAGNSDSKRMQYRLITCG